MVRATLLVIMASLLVLPAGARLVRDPPAATGAPATGGLPIRPGQAALACTGAAALVPCVAQPEDDTLQRFAAAVRLAIVRAANWERVRWTALSAVFVRRSNPGPCRVVIGTARGGRTVCRSH